MTIFFEAERGNPMTKSMRLKATYKWEFLKVAIHLRDANAQL